MRASMVLSLVCTGLAGIIWLEMKDEATVSTSGQARPVDAALIATPPVPVIALPEPGLVRLIVARPLFEPSRRPPAMPAERSAGSTSVELPSTIELTGTMLTEGGKAALVQIAGAPARWVRLGD